MREKAFHFRFHCFLMGYDLDVLSSSRDWQLATLPRCEKAKRQLCDMHIQNLHSDIPPTWMILVGFASSDCATTPHHHTIRQRAQ